MSGVARRGRRDDAAVLASGRALTGRERLRLLTEVLTTYAEVRWRMRHADIRTVIRRLRGDADEPPARFDAVLVGRRLASPVSRTLGPLPWDSRCLMRSLTLMTMLARRGVRATVVIGVESGPAFGAHAWVELDGRPMLPTYGFEPLVAI